MNRRRFLATSGIALLGGCTFGDPGESVAVRGERRVEFVADLGVLALLADHPGEALEFLPVALQDDPALSGERVGGDLGSHEGVAVTVAARPRAELEQLRDLDRPRFGEVQCSSRHRSEPGRRAAI